MRICICSRDTKPCTVCSLLHLLFPGHELLGPLAHSRSSSLPCAHPAAASRKQRASLGCPVGLVMPGELQRLLWNRMSFYGKACPTKLAQVCFEIFWVSWYRKSYQAVLSLSQSSELNTYISL